MGHAASSSSRGSSNASSSSSAFKAQLATCRPGRDLQHILKSCSCAASSPFLPSPSLLFLSLSLSIALLPQRSSCCIFFSRIEFGMLSTQMRLCRRGRRRPQLQQQWQCQQSLQQQHMWHATDASQPKVVAIFGNNSSSITLGSVAAASFAAAASCCCHIMEMSSCSPLRFHKRVDLQPFNTSDDPEHATTETTTNIPLSYLQQAVAPSTTSVALNVQCATCGTAAATAQLS